MAEGNYTRCGVNGYGEIFAGFEKRGMRFSIVEMSAEGVRIFSAGELEPDTGARMKIRLPSLLFQVNISVTGRVDRKNQGRWRL